MRLYAGDKESITGEWREVIKESSEGEAWPAQPLDARIRGLR